MDIIGLLSQYEHGKFSNILLNDYFKEKETELPGLTRGEKGFITEVFYGVHFSTLKLPNPEEKSAFALAEKLGNDIKAHLLIATDPDADRLGIAIRYQDEYVYINGNQTGALMLYYLLNEKSKIHTLPKKGVVFNTIVTSDFGAKIARSFGMDIISTLTGFKFIGEQARYLETDEREFIFGYEESYGYVVKDFVRDKDSLQAMLLISEAATFYYNTENKTLYEKLLDIYQKYGYYYEGLENIHLLGKTGSEKIVIAMANAMFLIVIFILFNCLVDL